MRNRIIRIVPSIRPNRIGSADSQSQSLSFTSTTGATCTLKIVGRFRRHIIITTSVMPPMSTPISMVVEHESMLSFPSLNSLSYWSRSSGDCCAECSADMKMGFAARTLVFIMPNTPAAFISVRFFSIQSITSSSVCSAVLVWKTWISKLLLNLEPLKNFHDQYIHSF